MEKLKILFEKYNFDYIYINPNDMDKVNFEFLPEEIFADFAHPKFYFGTMKLNNTDINVYWDRKIAPGDIIFKYKDIKKERCIKFLQLNKK